MNYHELKKQATPGPLRVYDKHDEFAKQPCISMKAQGDETNVNVVAFLWTAGGVQREQEANAALLAHCVNKFDKALEALKLLVGNHSCPACGEVATHKDHCWLRRRIAELETVE